MATSKDRLVDALEKMTIVYERFNDRLGVLDTAQAELLGSVESLRETMHTLKNQLSPLLTKVDIDGKEIGEILKKLDEIQATVNDLSKKHNGALLRAYVDGG